MATKTVTETAPIAEGDYVRPLEPKDVRMVKMLIGQGYMEGLTRANKRGESWPHRVTNTRPNAQWRAKAVPMGTNQSISPPVQCQFTGADPPQ